MVFAFSVKQSICLLHEPHSAQIESWKRIHVNILYERFAKRIALTYLQHDGPGTYSEIETGFMPSLR